MLYRSLLFTILRHDKDFPVQTIIRAELSLMKKKRTSIEIHKFEIRNGEPKLR